MHPIKGIFQVYLSISATHFHVLQKKQIQYTQSVKPIFHIFMPDILQLQLLS